ncbi:MAG: TIGR00268 family protein, partial [Candidatus Omnitrophota bacterium]
MQKIDALKKILKKLDSVVVAYSGGKDSAFLLKIAVDTLGADHVIAVTARSETYPQSEYREAVKLAKSIGMRHLTICTNELSSAEFIS